MAGGLIGEITSYPGTGKASVVTIFPLTHSVMDSNSGGHFGPYLKFAGWDALEVQGKAPEDVVIFIDGDAGSVTIETAPLEAVDTHLLNRQLTEMYAHDESDQRSISVASAGQVAHHALLCGLNLSYYDSHRKEVRIKQAARGGSGSVLRDKQVKAIMVRYGNLSSESNGSADPALLRKVGQRINKEIAEFDASQNDMRRTSTPYLLRKGFGTRKDDMPPYRAMGPATVKEYESRHERYDDELRQEVGIDPQGMTSQEKVVALRQHRQERYERLVETVYRRRGWTANGVPPGPGLSGSRGIGGTAHRRSCFINCQVRPKSRRRK